MNLFLILLPFVVFASPEFNQSVADALEAGKKSSELLALALKNAVTRVSDERPADYLADYFIYRHCDLTLNKEQMRFMKAELIFEVMAGFPDMDNSMLIHAFHPSTGDILRIRVKEDSELLGGYLIQQIIVLCPGRGFA